MFLFFIVLFSTIGLIFLYAANEQMRADDRYKETDWAVFKFRRITRSSEGTPYLDRLTLFGCPWFSLKLHHIRASDDDCPHDHPWWFISLILKGGYYESRGVLLSKTAWYGPGRLLYRSAKSIHRLDLKTIYPLVQVDMPSDASHFDLPPASYVQSCWTLVLTGRRIRNWGFYTKGGWVPWRRYSAKTKC
jgi:hypothetical protein